MSDRNVLISSAEQNTLTEVLLDAKKDRIKHREKYADIDSVIDKVAGRITLLKRDQRSIQMYDGAGYSNIYQGGKFQSEHGVFTIQEILDDSTHIKVNGNWHHKGEFEPAIVIHARGKSKGISR